MCAKRDFIENRRFRGQLKSGLPYMSPQEPFAAQTAFSAISNNEEAETRRVSDAMVMFSCFRLKQSMSTLLEQVARVEVVAN